MKESDNSFSAMIRPLALAAILVMYFTLALLSGFGINCNQVYVELLGQWGMLIMSFYYGGRTIEKIYGIKNKGDK